jgi:hypothetical protein
MEKGKKNHGFLKAGSVLSLLIVGGVAGIMYLGSIQESITETTVEVARYNYLVTEGPGEGSTALINMQIRPHAADPGTTYASNVSTGTAYEFSTVGNESAAGQTPYATAFDIVMTVSVAWDDGYNQTSSAWDNSYMWCTLTCADLSIGANTNMTEIQIANNSQSRWMHYYLNNGGAGYTVVLGEHFNLTSCKFWVKRPV